jgi:NADPH:quinone reductase-like Zn-dependent oxidoreductase
MKAAVVTSFGNPPRYADFPAPVASGPHDLVVDVLAAGLHPRVRSQANGSHYTSTGDLPLVPGIDGVGRDADGQLRYFILEHTPLGTMAEQTLTDDRRSVVLPAGTDPVAVAAAINPAMSSWLALRYRTDFRAGQDILILGATGSAGRMAVSVAKLFGARRIIAAGRNPDRLAGATALGATETVSLNGTPEEVRARLASAAAGVDVVLDYVWGEPAVAAMAAIITARPDKDRPLTWVEIGSMGGLTAPIPSAALRAAKFTIVGSGQGSVGTGEIIAALPGLAGAITAGDLAVDARAVPLADVGRAWAETKDSAERVVITPGA